MRAAVVVVLFALSGCATSGYQQYYHDETGGQDYGAFAETIPGEFDRPKILVGTDPIENSRQMYEDGYIQLGYSSFNGPLEEPESAGTWGRAIRAAVVIVYSKFSNTVTGLAPITTPTVNTSYTTTNATAYGSNGGYVNAYGNGTTTTYGTQTNYIPYSVDRYNQGAQYFIKAKPLIFGAWVQDLSQERRQELSSNKGVEIYVVVKGSPAFKADFFRGDIIKRIGKNEIMQVSDYHAAIAEFAGKEVEFEIIRNGRKLKKKAELNEAPTSTAQK